MSCSERLRREMRLRGIRITPQRSVILETVSHLGGHPSATEVYREAARRLPGLNPATVYRTLDSLQAAGLVDAMAGAGGRARFALRDLSHPHHHLVCVDCGGELELDAGWITDLARQVRRRKGFRLHTHHLTLTGQCRECAARAKAETG
jgi:Fur family ferric uptake transcriptional regulator